jgi:hypothetical protein
MPLSTDHFISLVLTLTHLHVRKYQLLKYLPTFREIRHGISLYNVMEHEGVS